MRRKFIPLSLALALLAGLAFWMPRNGWADWLTIGPDSKHPARVQIDETPLQRKSDGAMPTSYADIIDLAAPSVVSIATTRPSRSMPADHPLLQDPFFRRFFETPDGRMPQQAPQQSLGSGVIVSTDGYVLTNNHVIEHATDIRVILGDNSREYVAELIGTDPQTDIAVLKVDAKDLPAVTLGRSEHLRVGDVVFAIGNPFGVGQTTTQGIVSATQRGIGIVDYEDFIQTDAAVNPGNSGGALIDARGRLIGINTAIVSRSGGSAGVGFAVPIDQARATMETLISHGEVRRGFLGVTIQDVDRDLQRAFDLPDMEGALVNNVMEDGAAAAAGIRTGDVIRSFDGHKVRDVRDLRNTVAGTPPGREVAVTVWRDGKDVELQAKLHELPHDAVSTADARGPRRGEPRGESHAFIDGVRVEPFDPQRHARLRIPGHLDGLVVAGVDPSSEAAQSDLRPGDLIQSVNRHDVHDLDSARQALKDGPQDQILLYVWRDGQGRYVVVETPRG